MFLESNKKYMDLYYNNVINESKPVQPKLYDVCSGSERLNEDLMTLDEAVDFMKSMILSDVKSVSLELVSEAIWK